MNDNKRISLIDRLKSKDIQAFEKLFFKYHGRLVLFANKYTGNLQVSQDLVQEVFLKLWEKPKIILTIRSPKAYLFQAVRNSCLNHCRRLKIKCSVEEELVAKKDIAGNEAYFDHCDPLYNLLEHELGKKIDDIVQSMPEKCREVYNMSRHDFLKNKQIAKKLGISVKMVEKHISKALLLLRSELSEFMIVFIILLLH